MPLSARISTGVPSLDTLLDRLIDGDNVVFISPRDARYDFVERSFVEQSPADVLVVAATPTDLRRTRPDGVQMLDATRGSTFSGPTALADEIDRRMRDGLSRIVVDDFDELAVRWGADEAVRFFARMCPSMLQAGAITYWRLTKRLGTTVIDGLRQVTQILLDVRGDRLHVVKAESRDRSLTGSMHRITTKETEPDLVLARDSTAGRLAQGLATLRRDLGLTQGQLAEIAGVTPSAVSQAENGVRGLSLDTLLTLSDRLGLSLDRIVNSSASPGYHLARHDRSRAVRSMIALADDSTVGMRAYLVNLEPGEEGTAPFSHAGVELVAVLRGVVQVQVGDDRPVLRAGDSLLTRSDGVAGWKNLRPEQAALYWVLRD